MPSSVASRRMVSAAGPCARTSRAAAASTSSPVSALRVMGPTPHSSHTLGRATPEPSPTRPGVDPESTRSRPGASPELPPTPPQAPNPHRPNSLPLKPLYPSREAV
ncbi:hypothetical protein Stsp01_00480 [Streptomyces sp. NBRC 13847]|nr:hypothetical protein Stsp01_00480 [Streptomyces sp. NBRC 13847]